jgi:phosphoribosyl-AMP cyclohydrolase / phosphoribosyl-ATP pyrophosphohydrolase
MESDLVIDPKAIDNLDFEKGSGLLPAVVQHAGTGAVLMLGYMSREALEASLTRRRVVFFSRSKGRLWEKGETSGNGLELVEVRADCDRDALLVTARPKGPTCHLGRASCFGDGNGVSTGLAFLGELERVIGERIAKRPDGSYTAKLAAEGVKRVAQKVGEEALEVALAATGESDDELLAEAADLIYHLLVLLETRGLRLEQVVEELRGRHEGRRSA